MCSHEKADKIAGSRSDPATEATVKQIGKAESIVFDVPPLDLPEDKPIFVVSCAQSLLILRTSESALHKRTVVLQLSH